VNGLTKLDRSSGSADCSAHRSCKQGSGRRIERTRWRVVSRICCFSWESEDRTGYTHSAKRV